MAKIKVKGYTKKDGTRVAESDRDVRGVWFEGRRTAIVVRAKKRSEAISKAKAKLRRGGTAVKKVRQLNSSELNQAKKGRWVRSGPNGEGAGYEGMRGQGPPVGGYKKKINFTKAFKGLPDEEFVTFVQEGKDWAKKNRLTSKNHLVIRHDVMHTAAEKINPKYRLAPINPKFLKKVKRENPYYPKSALREKAETLLRINKNEDIEEYVSGLEGDKVSSLNPNYWRGRRDRKKKLPKEYKVFQHQATLPENQGKARTIKPTKGITPAGAGRVKSHTRKTKEGFIRVKGYFNKKKNR